MFSKQHFISVRFRQLACSVLAVVACAANGQTAWVQSQRSGNEARFLFANQIQRYDLAGKAWLSSITLPRAGATAMAADAQGAAVAYGTAIYRYAPDFTAEAAIGTTSSATQSLFFDGNLLIAVHSSGLYGRVTVFNRTTGSQLGTVETYVDSLHGASHAPETNRLYGRTQGISPADIVTTSYTDAGVVASIIGSPYHGSYPSATKTWVFPNEARVVDSSGTVYSAPGLTYAGSFAGSLIDIAFNGDVPIVLRNGELAAFTSNLVETGRTAVTTQTTSSLHVTDREAFVFSPASGTPGVQVVSLSSLNAPQPGEPVDPNGLAYAVDDAFVDRDGNLLLFSKAQLSLFRWSPAQRAYTGSFPLLGVPDFAAYSAENHSAYFAYASQVVRRMDLASGQPAETPLFSLPQKPNGLATAGQFIVASDPSGAWGTHYVFSPAGELLDSLDWNYRSRVWEWDPVQGRIYFFRDSQSPNDLHYETIDATGQITGEGETPYHGDFTVTPPI
ncbi:MAG: hypothetical protein MUF04_04920, partial [Akkermansiaceae bacterium]|nr:hypothetical protein [Akkermansiaceae bacterium]